MDNSKYRKLVDGDIVQVGDEWINVDWFMDGDGSSIWYSIGEDSKNVGKIYDSSSWREMRRPVQQTTSGVEV